MAAALSEAAVKQTQHGYITDGCGVFGYRHRLGKLSCKHVIPYLFVSALESKIHIDHVARYKNHRGQRHEPAHSLTPTREHVVPHCERNHLYGAEQEHPLRETQDVLCILTPLTAGGTSLLRHGCRLLILTLFIAFILHVMTLDVLAYQFTYADNERGEHHPAQLPPYTRSVADHLLDVVVELVHTWTDK